MKNLDKDSRLLDCIEFYLDCCSGGEVLSLGYIELIRSCVRTACRLHRSVSGTAVLDRQYLCTLDELESRTELLKKGRIRNE